MSDGLQLTRAWHQATKASLKLAETTTLLAGERTRDDLGNALIQLDEARKALAAAGALVDQEIAEIGSALQTR